MSLWIHPRWVLAVLALVLAACDDGTTTVKRDDPGSAGAGGEAPWVIFEDPSSDFATSEVFDSNREVVRFHLDDETMVALDGTSISGWTTSGNDLDWDRNAVLFQVAFGWENGERRVYFTETATSTICDLVISGPDKLRIFATNELPPQE